MSSLRHGANGAVDLRVQLAVDLTWMRAGLVVLNEAGALRFPIVPTVPGLYRFTLGEGVYIGEAANLARRMQHYRTPGPTQPTNRRLNQLMLEHLATVNQEVVLDLVTEAALVVGGITRAADLTRKEERVLIEHAAVAAVVALGRRCLNRLGHRLAASTPQAPAGREPRPSEGVDVARDASGEAEHAATAEMERAEVALRELLAVQGLGAVLRVIRDGHAIVVESGPPAHLVAQAHALRVAPRHWRIKLRDPSSGAWTAIEMHGEFADTLRQAVFQQPKARVDNAGSRRPSERKATPFSRALRAHVDSWLGGGKTRQSRTLTTLANKAHALGIASVNDTSLGHWNNGERLPPPAELCALIVVLELSAAQAHELVCLAAANGATGPHGHFWKFVLSVFATATDEDFNRWKANFLP